MADSFQEIRLAQISPSGGKASGTILWRRDGLAAIQFYKAVNVAGLLAGCDYSPSTHKPRAPRVELEAAARLRIGALSRTVALRNISQTAQVCGREAFATPGRRYC